MLDKVRDVRRRHRSAGHLELRIEVDGGIAADTIEQAAAGRRRRVRRRHRRLRRRRPGRGDPPAARPGRRAARVEHRHESRRTADDVGLEPEERPDLILVVDDDEDIASFVEFNLKLHGFEVIARPRRPGGAGGDRDAAAPTWPSSTG